MIISHDDATQLAQRARRLHDDKALPASLMLLDACASGVLRRLADQAEAHRLCRSRACRRAHRCAGRPLRCGDALRRLRPKANADALIDEMYWRTLQRLVDEDAAAGRKR